MQLFKHGRCALIQAVNQCEQIFPCAHCKRNTAKSEDISTCTYCSTTQGSLLNPLSTLLVYISVTLEDYSTH